MGTSIKNSLYRGSLYLFFKNKRSDLPLEESIEYYDKFIYKFRMLESSSKKSGFSDLI